MKILGQTRCYNPQTYNSKTQTKEDVPQHFVWIKHRLLNGRYFYALYGHIKPYDSIKKGVRVESNQPIGEVAACYVESRNTLVLASHLHFGVWNSENDPPTDQLGSGPSQKAKAKAQLSILNY